MRVWPCIFHADATLPRARSSAEEAALLDKGFERNDKYDNTTVKDFRMQQEFGAKKFIKP